MLVKDIGEPPPNSTCDKCGLNVTAAVRITFQNGLFLDFCNHHSAKYTDRLFAAIEGS
jgi:hypothetical protein